MLNLSWMRHGHLHSIRKIYAGVLAIERNIFTRLSDFKLNNLGFIMTERSFEHPLTPD